METGKLDDNSANRRKHKKSKKALEAARAAAASLKGLQQQIAALKKPPASNSGGGSPPPATGGTPSLGDLQQRLQEVGARGGDIQISLAWNNGNDIDLHVICPSGERIYFKNRSSRCGGRLDIDRNARGPSDVKPIENVHWPSGRAPRGQFEVAVHHFRNWSYRDPTEFRIQVLVKGKVIKNLKSQLSFHQVKHVYTFTFPGG